jgi:hypothetical protein
MVAREREKIAARAPATRPRRRPVSDKTSRRFLPPATVQGLEKIAAGAFFPMN